MRYITIPQPVIVEDFDGTQIPVTFKGRDGQDTTDGYTAGTPWTLHMYLRHFVFGDVRFGGSAVNAESAFRIRRAFRIHRELGAIVTLDDRDHALLLEIIEKPLNPQPGVIAAAMWPLMEAILLAKKEDPREAILLAKKEDPREVAKAAAAAAAAAPAPAPAPASA